VCIIFMKSKKVLLRPFGGGFQERCDNIPQ
jgi:hypothetical protein